MAMGLPTYNQPGWGATLNNYLRELNQRISKIEASSENSPNNNQILGASVFNTGLTSTNGTCSYNGEKKYSTFKIDQGLDKLSFTGEYFITQATIEGNASLGKLEDAKWIESTSLNSNQTMLLCVDEDKEFHIIPFLQEVGVNSEELDYSFCRLGYITKIDDDHIYFTPCPNITIMDLHDKYNYIMRPTYKSNDTEKPQISVGSYSYMMEGLNYYQHFKENDPNNPTPIQVLENELYNVHTFENVVDYFLIQTDKNTGKENIVFKTLAELESYINNSDRNKIFVFYVTLAGIIFVREIDYSGSNVTIVDSTSLANFIVDTDFKESNKLFYYYSWLKPLELKRCAKDPFGKLRWHMASYNGISPQIIGTPIHTVDTNYFWADNYLMQINNTDESSRNYYGLRIRPYIQLKDNAEEGDFPDSIANPEKTNEYVVLNISGQPTPDEEETTYEQASIVVGSSTSFYFNYTSNDNSIKIKNKYIKNIVWTEGSTTSGRRMWYKTIDDYNCIFSASDATSGETEIRLYQLTKNKVAIEGTSSCTKNIITTLNPKTQPGILLYNYEFNEPLYFGGLENSNKVIFEIRNTGLSTSDYHLFFNQEIEAPLNISGKNDSKLTISNDELIGQSEDKHKETLNINWNTGIGRFETAQITFSTDNSDAFLIKNNINNIEYYQLLTEPSEWRLLDDKIYKKEYTYTDNKQLKIYFAVRVGNVHVSSYGSLDSYYNFDFSNTGSSSNPLHFESEGFTINFYYNTETSKFVILSYTQPSNATDVIGVVFEKLEYPLAYSNHNFIGDLSITGKTAMIGNAYVTGNLNISANCSANEFEVTSDIRHKNIHGVFNFSGLNVIDNLPIYEYTLKATPNKETIGITAQDLLKVLPQLVDTSDESHYKINESKLVYVCMQAIKELNTKISTLEEEIKSLRGH